MMETNESKVSKIRSVLEKHATSEGGTYLEADLYAYYATIDTQVAMKNEQVVGGLLGTILDFPPGPKMDRKVNVTERADYEPHYNAQLSEYAMFPSDRTP
jgi:hypothetical protein